MSEGSETRNKWEVSENSAYLKEAFILSPAFKDYIWGGTRLRDDFGKTCDFERIAESWELSCHKDGLSVIASGSFKGKTLAEYIRDNPATSRYCL